MHHCGSETFIWSVCTFHCKCFPGRPGLNHIPLGAHCVPVYDCDSVPSAKSWRGWDEMLTRLCRAVPCCLFHPVINKAQSSVMGPAGPQSILADGRGAANGSRCKPWPSFSPARPSLPAPPGYSGLRSTWASSTWKTMSCTSLLRLNCEQLGGHPAWGGVTQAYYGGICAS